ncbi:MAG: hypothetical protein HRU20_31535, partial [Pseudomonadales bacterium]|nr:hypothetical protein [Pseudomonadales bacterium]
SDNDGFSDVHETACQSDPTNALDMPKDLDGDSVPDCLEPLEIVEREIDPGEAIESSGYLSLALFLSLILMSGLRCRKHNSCL